MGAMIPGPRPRRGTFAAWARPIVEVLVVLAVGLLLGRTFVAEAYIVPTGSMAPTLLGQHREWTCPGCRHLLALGEDESGRTGRPVCGNCGAEAIDPEAGRPSPGDRLLVLKPAFDLRAPRRWEAAVFQNPEDPSQAYVKRIAGLPGEAIEIRGGDIRIDGRIARKTLAEQRALRIPVFDNDFPPDDSERSPRWTFRRGDPRRPHPTGWTAAASGFRHDPAAGLGSDVGDLDWLEYRHRQPVEGRSGPVRDFLPYNGADLPGDNRVDDLILEAQIEATATPVSVRLGGAMGTFVVTFSLHGRPPTISRDGQLLSIRPRPAPSRRRTGTITLEASWVDRRLMVALDDELLFDPLDFDEDTTRYPGGDAPALGVEAGRSLTVRRLRLFRDVYYTGELAGMPLRAFGVGRPFRLGPDEYFMLGDNSPISSDSRFWSESPVVRRAQLIGKPFLVHLPSRLVAVRVFGRVLYWIPDPSEIRYIR